MKITNSSRPGRSRSVPLQHSTVSSAAPTTISIAFRLNCFRLTTDGMHSTEMPRIKPRFAVTEPTALPTARSTSPWSTPVTDTVNSGSVVARETMVAPMMNRGTPVASAIQTAPSKNQSPPLTMSSSPNRNSSTVIQILPISIPTVSFKKSARPFLRASSCRHLPAVSHTGKVSLFRRARAAQRRRVDELHRARGRKLLPFPCSLRKYYIEFRPR